MVSVFLFRRPKCPFLALENGYSRQKCPFSSAKKGSIAQYYISLLSGMRNIDRDPLVGQLTSQAPAMNVENLTIGGLA